MKSQEERRRGKTGGAGRTVAEHDAFNSNTADWSDRYDLLDQQLSTARAVSGAAVIALEQYLADKAWHRLNDLGELVRLTAELLRDQEGGSHE